jgi:hypothetical protein
VTREMTYAFLWITFSAAYGKQSRTATSGPHAPSNLVANETHPENVSGIPPQGTLRPGSGRGSLAYAWGAHAMTMICLALAWLILFGVMCETAPTLDHLN